MRRCPGCDVLLPPGAGPTCRSCPPVDWLDEEVEVPEDDEEWLEEDDGSD